MTTVLLVNVDEDIGESHHRDGHHHSGDRFLHELLCSLQPLINLHALHLHARGRGAFGVTGIYGIWAKGGEGWVGYAICGLLWVSGSGGLWFFMPMANKPKRFVGWTMFLLVYYALVGVHASYDKVVESECKSNGN
ncbi:hypothetical protein Fmac_016262 [Flemingia macrophylla]|uniref:Uncharacterized protein n=1 Tax=Flemingia macrophylla TaxID=520843 RepID=A0ABD1MGY3_9FABA